MPSHHPPSVEMQASILTAFDAILDVRSPAEYAEDHLPGALNLPVLDDAERARVGTLYKQVSPFAAKRAGAALVSRNIARHLETALAELPREARLLVYCWRGGKRSGAMLHVLREIGWDASALAGGYKAYRRYVVRTLEELPARFAFRVVHGVTGSGKSRLLQALGRAGAQVLDLEALAAHRGSVLGDLPGRAQPTQKHFETRVLHALGGFDAARPVYVEAESRRIGQVQVPEALIGRIREGECVLLEADLATRTALLSDEYRHFFADRASLETQLECLVDLHGRAVIDAWRALAARGEWNRLIERLLEEHYDPAYRRSAQRNFARLPQARRLRLRAAQSDEFARLAAQLIEEAPREALRAAQA